MINFSELLWKSGRPRKSGAGSAALAVSGEVQTASRLDQVPTEKVQLSAGSRVALLTDSRSPGADRLRFLRMRLLELRQLAKLKSIVVTSPMPEDGKSTIAMSLATGLSERGQRPVLLLEADLHQPTIGRSLGVRLRPGLAECLEDGVDPLTLLRNVEPLGWYLLHAGNPRGNPTELIQSDALKGVMESLAPYFDWILIDTPPVIPLTDALSLSRQVDATLLVARADRTPREAIEQALTVIGRKHVLGLVLNCADSLERLYSEYYGHYGKK
jgi:capsular exopolysaccharide synthesis family protein